MLNKILLPFTLVSNFATLLGLLITYEAAPASIQSQVARWMILVGGVASVLGYVAFAIFVMKPKLDTPKPTVDDGKSASTPRRDAMKLEMDKMLADRRIYIGPSGTSLRLINEQLRVSLQIFPCVAVQLLHVKVQVGSSKDITATLSDAEPHELEAGKKFEKTLERSLNDAELQEMKRDIVLVQGTAKFAGSLEVSFVFNANPLRI
jgi:hypothetical protein